MGTNYYLHWPEKRCDHCGSVSSRRDPLHIGKSSAGWHFSLNTITFKSAGEWKGVLDKAHVEGAIITASYYLDSAADFASSAVMTPAQFWEMVQMKRTAPNCQASYRGPFENCATCVDGVDHCPYSFS